jgi:hypothetical protein
MKKNALILCIVMAFAMVQTVFSQDVTLRFTSAKTDGTYVRLDSVTVQNTNRSWSETVVYPDTVLNLQMAGIFSAQASATDIVAYPNPFNGTTNVAVTMPQSSDAMVQVFNLAGQKVLERAMKLESGENLFEVRLQEPQAYLLSITTTHGCRTIKLLNRNAGGGNSLSFRGNGNIQEKLHTSQPFQDRDVLRIIGYATENNSVVTSREVLQELFVSHNYTLVFGMTSVPVGDEEYFFSVGPNRHVLISSGNLQYTTNGTHTVAGGGADIGTWRFAPNPWDVIGNANSNISSNNTSWIDLFGWGTSGYNNKYPYMTSVNSIDYGNGYYDIANTNYDWGVYNAISNGGNQPGLWRTLTQSEWLYLLNYRSTNSGIRYAKATLNNVSGLIIVPDDWETSTYTLNSTNDTSAAFSANIITTSQWPVLEVAGCVFLPVAGYRYYTTVFLPSTNGDYWTATYYDEYSSYFMNIIASNVNSFSNHGRYFGRSVRLVQDVP